jgi:hypothetical protein
MFEYEKVKEAVNATSNYGDALTYLHGHNNTDPRIRDMSGIVFDKLFEKARRELR